MTTPTKAQWIAILTQARAIQKLDEAIQDASDSLYNILAPSAYSPILEMGAMHGYLCAIEAAFGEQAEENVSYWVYDVQSMKGPVMCEVNGKKYNAKELLEYVEFVMEMV